jgi:hypothetical protein
MRLDLIVGYALTALFMVAMLVVEAELLFASGESISGKRGSWRSPSWMSAVSSPTVAYTHQTLPTTRRE